MPASVTTGGVVVAGEALVDLVAGPAPDEVAERPGGGPYNTARTLARLEVPVRFLGAISGDGRGRALHAELVADGVAVDAVVPTDRPTTLAVAALDPNGVASYTFEAAGSAATGLRREEALAALGAITPEALHVGSLGLVFDPLADAVEALVEAAGENTLVMVDPNIRPAAMTDEAAYRTRLDRVLARCDVVKVSVEDLDWLRPGMTPLEGARSLLSAGAAATLVTAGAEGALVVTANTQVPISPVTVRVVDTIGAGDAFGGGFLAHWCLSGLGRGQLADVDRLTAAAEFASTVAARTCLRLGAVPPRLSELSALGVRVPGH